MVIAGSLGIAVPECIVRRPYAVPCHLHVKRASVWPKRRGPASILWESINTARLAKQKLIVISLLILLGLRVVNAPSNSRQIRDATNVSTGPPRPGDKYLNAFLAYLGMHCARHFAC